MTSQRRLQAFANHLKPSIASQSCSKTEVKQDGKKFPGRHDILKWNGWGYADSQFSLIDDKKACFTGSRYILSGHTFPKLLEWFENECHADITKKNLPKPLPNPESLPKPIINEVFIDQIRQSQVEYTLDPIMRLFHGHGHTGHEIFLLRHGELERIPDVVIWPRCHKEVEAIVKAAVMCNVCIIPFGGGTSVSSALECPSDEMRMIVSLDMTEMKHILWIDEENLVAHIEAGIIGEDLEQQVFELPLKHWSVPYLLLTIPLSSIVANLRFTPTLPQK
jgi:alkyldihydroxyacetonephosphate synthase